MDEATAVATQPAQQAQTSVEKQGAANSSVSDFAKMLLQRQPPAQEQAVAAETAPEAETPKESTQAAEESNEPSGEAETKETEVEQAETESEEKPEDALSHENQKLDPKLQEKIDKRIGKEVAKRKALEAELDSLKEQLAAKPEPEAEKPVVVAPTPDSPLANIESQEALEQYAEQAAQTILWAETQLDREDFNDNPPMNGDKPLTKAQVREIKANALLAERIHVPARQKFLTARAEAQTKAITEFPYLADKKSPEYAEAQAILKTNPYLHKLPNRDWIVGVMVEGNKAIAARKTAQAKPTPKPKVVTKAKPSGDQTLVTTGDGSSRTPGQAQRDAAANLSKVLGGKRGVNAGEFAQMLLASSQSKNS